MRKIIPKHKEEKKNRMKQFLVGGILVFIMLISILGYAFRSEKSEEGKKINYNGFEFEKQNEFWFTSISGLQFAFSYNPAEIERINPYISLNLNNYYAQPLYIYSEDFDAEAEIYRNLDQIILRRQYACLENQTCEKDFPIKTCKDNFIIIKEANSSEIRQEENCIFIQGKKEELVKISDEFLFKILGVQ